MWRSYRSLLPALVYGAWLRLQVQFARTLLGSAWIGLYTLLSIGVLGTIYGTLTAVQDWSAYMIYLALGVVSWNTLATSIAASCTLLERSRERILNQPLPLGVFVLEEWLSSSLALLIALLAVLLVLGSVHPALWWRLLDGGWLGILNLLLGCLLLTLLISPLAASFADLHQIMPILLQIGFLAAPILYYRQSLGKLAWISHLNPLYLWVRLMRDPFLGSPHWPWQWLALGSQGLLIILLLHTIDRRRMAVIRWL